MMKKKIFEIIFDCGSSKIRGGAIDPNNKKSCFSESNFFFDPL